MKAVILAAGLGIRMGELGRQIPKCLIEVNGKSLLQRSIEILKKYNLTDITVIVGKNGECWNKETYSKIRKINENTIVNKINEETFQAYSLFLAMTKKDNIIALDGDLYFKQKTLEALLYSKKSNVLLSRSAFTTGDEGGKIKTLGDGQITYCGMEKPDDFPWDIYSGMLKFGENIYDALKETITKNRDKSILDSINELCKEYPIYAVRPKYKFSTDESGGYTSLSPIAIIRKEGYYEEGIEKLKDEIGFLKTLPKSCKKHFPEVIEVKQKKKKLYYEMPKYDLPSLRRLLFSGVIDSNKAIEIIDNILKFLFSEMYSRDNIPVSLDYMDKIHFKRVWGRLKTLTQKSDFFKKLEQEEKIICNETEYDNIPIALSRLQTNADLIKLCTPKYLSPWCYSDLHFSNILVDMQNKSFILVDPRGYKHCDYYYDFGKLWHSAEGLFDFISENQFGLQQPKKNNFSWNFINMPILREYEKIKEKLPALFQKYSPEPMSNLMRKVEFNEAMHFCSFMPFMLDKYKTKDRALIAYLTGVKLINEFNGKYCKEFEDFVNINEPSTLDKIKKNDNSD